jgi:hypothetical protein
MTQAGWGGVDPVQVADSTDYEMGTEYIANQDVTLTHVRVFSGASPTPVLNRKGRIWSIAGAQLGQATMADSLPAGWQLYALDTPLPMVAGSRFIVSFSTFGNYAAINGAFTAAGVNSADGALTARKTTDGVHGNGVFNDSPGPGNFPATTFGATFYGIDVGYDLGISGNTAPVITNLALSATGLSASATITATDAQTLAGASYVIDWGDGSTTPSASGSHTYATGGLKAILASVTDSGGLSDYMAGAIDLVAPNVGGLRPNDEIVTVAWLKAAVPYLGSAVATELPKDNTSWSASGFTKVSAIGGDPDLYVPVSKAAMSIDCYGASTNSGRPPWNLAGQLAEQIKAAIWEHGTVPRVVALPAAYASARVMTVIPRSEPRRVPDDVAAYARYTMDIEIWWAKV